MRILIVGAGAVGQPFGLHLDRGGAEVAFAVKPAYREEAESGFRLHRYHLFGGCTHERFDDFDVFVDYEEIGAVDWDQVWLTVSGTAVRGEWLPALLDEVGETTLVSLQPGLEVREYLEGIYPAERLVSGRISIIAWETPLGDEDIPEGEIAYFVPPAQPVYFGGPRERAEAAAAALDAGGCPADYYEDVVVYGAFSAAVLETAVAALETANWSFRDFRRSESLALASSAAREALEVVGAKFERRSPLSMRVVANRFAMRLGLPLASFALPFDLETYLQEHFTKVGDQTREELADFIEVGEERGVDVDHIRRLLRALPEHVETGS